jgi:hypothetical protein
MLDITRSDIFIIHCLSFGICPNAHISYFLFHISFSYPILHFSNSKAPYFKTPLSAGVVL